MTWGNTGTLTARWTESSTLLGIPLPQPPISSRSATACRDACPDVSKLSWLCLADLGFLCDGDCKQGWTSGIACGCPPYRMLTRLALSYNTGSVQAMGKGGLLGGSLHRVMLTVAACRLLNSISMCTCRETAVKGLHASACIARFSDQNLCSCYIPYTCAHVVKQL